MRDRIGIGIVAAVLLAGATARGQAGEPLADRTAEVAPARDAAATARDGAFFASTMAARIGDQRVTGLALGGFDSVSGGGVLDARVEGALYRRVAVRVEMSGAGVGTQAPRSGFTAGVRLALLRQETSGVDVGVAATYRTVGFSEANGVVELALLGSRRRGRFGAYGNAVYGQGFTRSERHVEGRLAALYSVGAGERVHLGLDATWHQNLGEVTSRAPVTAPGVKCDFLAGPVAQIAAGPLLVMAQAGPHVIILDDGARKSWATGVAAIGGVGTSF